MPLRTALASLLSLLACFSAASAEGPFPLGALLSLSGTCSDVGEMSRRGIELAVDDVNAAGGILGRPVSVIVEDTHESNSASAVTAYRRLLLNRGLHYIIGPSCSPAGLAVAPLAAKNEEIVLASPSIGLREFNEAGENIFKLWPYDEDGPKLIARYAIGKGWKKAAIFSSQQTWEEAQGKWIEREFVRLGGSVSAKVEPLPGETVLSAEAAKLAASRPDVVFLCNYTRFEVAAQQLAKAGYKGPKISTLMTEEKIRLASGALEGTVAYGYAPATKEFMAAYTARYGSAPYSIGADTSYDIVRLYAKAINEAGTGDPLVVRRKLIQVRDYPGASGRLSIDDKGGVLRNPILFVVRGQQLVPLE